MPPTPPSSRPDNDQTEAFLKDLPEIQPGQAFRFACHPKVPCFNACCSDLTLMLTPYDALTLRRGLNMPSIAFLERFATSGTHPQTGFPLIFMKMKNDARQSCPFVRKEGCSVYPHRPGACRAYPLGRASRLENGEVKERFFLVQEDHCRGFEQTRDWTPGSWYDDQDLARHNAENDRYMALMAKQRDTGRLLDKKRAAMALLALYQPDKFQEFIQHMRLFERLELTEQEQAAILSDEQTALDFAYNWLELLVFGHSDRLRQKLF